jgi:antitoxin component YwqK of YwqJK toxin-antitoxin module
MKLSICLFFSCFLPLFGFSTDSSEFDACGERIADFVEKAAPFRPEWKIQVVSEWDVGIPQEIVMRTPDRNLPMKKIFYYPSGEMREEIDLEPCNEDVNGRPHGLVISYYETGDVMRASLYSHGKKEGEEKCFSENGRILFQAQYKKGLLHGKVTTYWPSGGVHFEEEYLNGRPHGTVRSFYEGGAKCTEEPYVNGVLEGRRFSWWEKGNVKDVSFWRAGLLHNSSEQVAFTAYTEDGKVRGCQSFIWGQPHGLHTLWHGSGAEETKIRYKAGKREGLQEVRSEDGTIIARTEYMNDLPVGRSMRLHPNGKIAFSCHFSSPGTGVAEEFDTSGKRTKRYSMKNGEYDGEYQEWYANGQLMRHLHFAEGCFSGHQAEYFPSGRPRVSADYEKGLRQGTQEEWFGTGQISRRGSFDHGEQEGLVESWHLNGRKKYQATFHKGILSGSELVWYEDGKTAKALTWQDGKQTAKAFEWAPDGTLVVQEEWEDDLPNGTWIEWYESGRKKSERHYLRGDLVGNDESWFENGQKMHETVWKNGKIHGRFREWYEDGSLREEGEFIDGKPQKNRIKYFPPENGKSSQIYSEEHFKNGCYEGEQCVYFPNGKVKMSLTYCHGQLHGRKKICDESGKELFLATYNAGKLEGKVIHRRPNGMEEVQYFKDNHPEGLWQIYYPSHPTFGWVKALEATFRGGVLEGELAEFNEAGTKTLSVTYRGGKRNGSATMYSHDGRVVLTAEYVDGVQQGVMKRYFPSGALLRQTPFSGNLQEGEEISYFENGEISGRSNFHLGKLHGTVRNWNEKGVLIFEAEYTDGLRSGKWNKYFDNGSPKLMMKFQNDVLVSKKVYKALAK